MNKDSNYELAAFAFGVIPVIWFGILVAPYMNEGLIGLLSNIDIALSNPFSIQLCDQTAKTIIRFLMIYAIGISIYYSTKRNYRKTEEYGSARWGKVSAVCNKYKDNDYLQNKLFTQNVRMRLDGRKTRRNTNTIIIGGSGAGKTRFYGKPNIMQCNTSFVVLDPKGKEVLGYILQAVH